MTTFDVGAAPPLAGALGDPAQAPRDRRRRAQGQPFPGLTVRMFEEPIVAGRTLFGSYMLVSDPVGVRRVLVENAANYPKTPMDLRFFAALFGGGLLGSDGEVWRRHRRVMAPAFDPRSVAAYGPAIAASAREFLARWDALPDGAPIDMAQEMKALTLQVIARTVFSTDSAEIIDLIGGTLSRGLEAAAEANILDLLPVVGEWRMKARERRLAASSKGLDEAVAALVRAREANLAGAPADLLTRLVAAKDEEGGGGLTPKEIRDEIITIFMAGHETTAATLSWTWYVLSQRPAEAARLGAELDAVLAGRPPTPADLANLTYTRRVVEEAMRLFPAAPGLSTRRAREADEVCGHPVPKGASVTVMPWIIHRHRRLWDDPERFDPDRFSPERAAGRPRFAYLPFGGGPRVCIGQILAMNESILILAALAQHYRPGLAPGAEVIPHANVTLQFRGGLKMTLDRRSPSGPARSDLAMSSLA
jgi:cytochrome P450